MGSFYKYTVVVVLVFCCVNSMSQLRTDVPVSELDSLIREIPEFEGTELIDHLNLIATSISQRYPDSCLLYAEKALIFSREINYRFGEAHSIFNIGNAYFFNFDIKNSMLYYLSAMQIFEKFKTQELAEELGHVYMQIGVINRYIGNDLNAAKYYHKAISIYDTLQLTKNIIIARNELAYTFIRSTLYDSAFYYSGINIEDCKRLNYPELLAKIYDNYGIIYLWRDDARPEKLRFEGTLAIPYLDSALVYAKKFKNGYYEGAALTNLAECYHHYMNPPDYSLAEKYYKLSIKSAYKTKRYNDFVASYALIGELYADMGKLALSKAYLDSSILSIKEFYKNIDTAVFHDSYRKYFLFNYMYELRSYSYRALYKYYRAIGNYDSAIFYLQLKEKVLDSLQQVNFGNQIDYLLANEENENIQDHIQLLEQQKELERNKAQKSFYLILGLILLSIIAALMAMFYIRQNRFKSWQEKSDLQLRLFRTQLNPHFLFNSLSSIQNYVIKENPLVASDYIGRFSKLVRQILNNSTEEWITFENEIESIENYLELQKARYKDMFDYTIIIDDKIDPETIMVPPMLTQPFIENSIEHGFKNKDKKGCLQIRFELNGKLIRVEMEDDGIGRDKAKEILNKHNKDHKSMATQFTRERLQLINKKLKLNIRLDIIDMKDNDGKPTGTKIILDMPNRN